MTTIETEFTRNDLDELIRVFNRNQHLRTVKLIVFKTDAGDIRLIEDPSLQNGQVWFRASLQG